MKKNKVEESILIALAVILTIIFSIYYSLKFDISARSVGTYGKVTAIVLVIIIQYLMKKIGSRKEK